MIYGGGGSAPRQRAISRTFDLHRGDAFVPVADSRHHLGSG
jgi:hypothetical protein